MSGNNSRSSRQHRRYQLQWRPTFTTARGGGPSTRSYVLGEKVKMIGPDRDSQTFYPNGYDNLTMTFSEIVRVAYNSTLILPFNTSVALAQEYSPSVKNKVVHYNTLGGNSVTTFGQAVQKIGLRIKIIKAGENWRVYHEGLKALHYLSANQGRFYGSLYLIGYDSFPDKTMALSARYKVITDSLDFSQRADANTVVSADLQMFVAYDYSAKLGEKKRVWGSL